jgi:hypothetical protein
MFERTTRRTAILTLVAGLGATAGALAQPRPQGVAPPTAGWRPPALVVAGAEQPVRLQSLRIEVEVAAGVAETRVEMEFFNPNSRVLEGKLQFPLGAGQVVSGFALDIDGQMRDAVPVEKARAEQVFEDIARRRVDPGLLQTTLGNNYELRVYPLNPGKSRIVVLTLVEAAPARLLLPLAYAASVPRLDLTLRYAGAQMQPEIESGNPLGLAFERDPRGGFSARQSIADATLPRESLRIHAPATDGNAVEVTTEERNGETFFALTVPVAERSAPRPLPKSVQIVWDASGSGAQRQFDREQALLDAYFRRAGDTEVTLVRVADVAFAPERFSVRRGDWSALRRALQATGVRRRQQPRRGAPRRRLGRGPLVQRRPGQLRRALAAGLPGAGVHGQQHRQRRPGGAARAGRGERRPQHRPAGADPRAGGGDAAVPAAPSCSRRARSAPARSRSSRARRPPAG